MATRTNHARKTTPAKKTAPKPPAKKTTTRKTPTAKPAPRDRATLVDLRKPLTVRRRVFVGPHQPAELAAIRAALASASARLPIPVRAWNGPTAHLHDGTTLTHTPTHATTDQTPTFTATLRCPHGAIHTHTIHTAQDLHRARQITALCDQRTPQPKTTAVHPLPEGIRRTDASAADTEPLSADDITAGLTARTADTETAKEHPQP